MPGQELPRVQGPRPTYDACHVIRLIIFSDEDEAIDYRLKGVIATSTGRN